jgi:hypothetical protein
LRKNSTKRDEEEENLRKGEMKKKTMNEEQGRKSLSPLSVVNTR